MTEKKHQYHNIAQERVLRLQLLLAGHEADGLAPSALAKALGVSPSVITRDLWNLQHAGFAEQLDNGTWRLGPKPVQIANAFVRGLAAIEAKAADIRNRYTREPR